MAKHREEDTDDTDSAEESAEPETKQKYRITHNLNDGEIIALRKNIQRKLYGRLDEEKIALSMVNKKGDTGIYLTATKTELDDILERFREKAAEWSYPNPHFAFEEVEEEPDGMINGEDLDRIEAALESGVIEERNRQYVELGSLNAKLDVAKKDIAGLESKCKELNSQKTELNGAYDRLKTQVIELEKAKETLKSGNLAEALISFLKTRAESVETLDMILQELKESGLDVLFILNPPESAEKCAREKMMKQFSIDYPQLLSNLKLGETAAWEKCSFYQPEADILDVKQKIQGLQTVIESADPKVKQIVADSLKNSIDKFTETVRAYQSKFENWATARKIFDAYNASVAEFKESIAKAKKLQQLPADVKQTKVPVFAQYDADCASLYTPAEQGIVYDSLKKAIDLYAKILSEESIGKCMLIKITAKNGGEWKPLEALKNIKDQYSWTDAGKLGSKLGMIVQL